LGEAIGGKAGRATGGGSQLLSNTPKPPPPDTAERRGAAVAAIEVPRWSAVVRVAAARLRTSARPVPRSRQSASTPVSSTSSARPFGFWLHSRRSSPIIRFTVAVLVPMSFAARPIGIQRLPSKL